MKAPIRVLAAAAATVLLGVDGCARARGELAMTRGFDARVQDGFARARGATSRFLSLDSAVSAGYARDVQQCFADAHHGAMGFHHVNRSYVDATLDVERPEILLYERLPNGEYRFNGMEYIIPYRLWSRDSTPPSLMGLQLKRQDALKLWYLHMWAWTENSAGLFADFNPAVKCENPVPFPS